MCIMELLYNLYFVVRIGIQLIIAVLQYLFYKTKLYTTVYILSIDIFYYIKLKKLCHCFCKTLH
jgi:hypothetical protein